MVENLIIKMICDTPSGGGGVYLYETYLEWMPRSGAISSFKIKYSDIKDMSFVNTHKKRVTIQTRDGHEYVLMLYKHMLLIDTIKRQIEQNKIIDIRETPVEQIPEAKKEIASEKSGVVKELESLAMLYEKGILTKEEFEKAKAKILGI